LDTRARIEQLSDEDAISALVFLLDSEDQDTSRRALEGAQDDFAAALGEPEVRRELEAHAEDVTPAQRGELARLTLIAVSEEDEERRALVEDAIEHPGDAGVRDPVTLALVGAVVLALRPKIHIGKKPGEGWTIDFKTEPLKDSAMAKVIGKLLGGFASNS
jgi:hypothetical protein